LLAGETPRLSTFLRPRTCNPAFDQLPAIDQLENEPMNLNEPFSMILGKRGYGEIFQTLVHLGSEAAYGWVLQGVTGDADANEDG